MIIGVIAGGVFKGKDILEAARLRAVLNDFQKIQMAISMYKDTYGVLPGDDPKASERFGEDAKDGQGNGFLDDTESLQAWQHLYLSDLYPNAEPPSSKMGGFFSISHEPYPGFEDHWIVLGDFRNSRYDNGLLTPKQAQKLMNMGDGNSFSTKANEGLVRIQNGSNVTGDPCLNEGGKLNLKNTKPVCVILVKIQ